ncbi:unnamed protein product [Caenorhabditis angaria]|uniref:Uncharacterized protein n=1 Tax=Caenorhabditis angaria TaxID=860376 RepID=A0A9P1IG58_9PELO|nr:unnamed protein product [Caenorhabditis angaria]
MAATATKKVFEFTTDDDELNDVTDKGTMCDFYKLNLPASASILSKQIAKSQAKRVKKEERGRRRLDLSTVREQDETKLSASEDLSSKSGSPAPPPPSQNLNMNMNMQETFHTPRSRVDNSGIEAKLRRKASLPEETRKSEPMDEEEVQLLAMLLSGMNTDSDRKFSLPINSSNQPISSNQPPAAPPTPGLPKLPPNMKVSEWLLERSTSPDNLSVGTSVMLEDSGLALHFDEDEDEFFDAPEENELEDVTSAGLSLNRNMAMSQSLVRVEEETVTDGGNRDLLMNGLRSARSTSVSPRPTNEQQFVRQSPISATFNVKHSHTMVRNNQPITTNNNGMTVSQQLTSTPLSSRTARSVLRVHNINSSANQNVPKFGTITRRGISGIAKSQAETDSSPQQNCPQVTINPSTPSRPASVASSIGSKSMPQTQRTSNLEGLQDLIHMQEEALRRAADGQVGRKLSLNGDLDANRQSTSIHSSVGSLSSSKSNDDNKLATNSKIPGPRSRIPTPRGSTVAKRVHSVATAVLEQSMEQEMMNVSEYQIRNEKDKSSSRRLIRSTILSSPSNCDSSSLASFLLKPPRK